jgi:1,4-dihydroxy-2-naphthoyl-CoA hydrolase
MYTMTTTVRLPETDAAGILFFGGYFRIAHDAYESFLTLIGFGLDYVIHESPFLILIAHAEAEFDQPLRLGERITVELRVEKVGQTSFVISYVMKNPQGQIAARLKTVHVTVDKSSGEKTALPAKLKEKLSAFK